MSNESAQNEWDYQLYIKSKQDTFNYSFTVLCFASLALSFQYSPNMGHKLSYLLMASWACYLISALCGGWRLMMAPQYDNINRIKNKYSRSLNDRKMRMSDPNYITMLEAGRVINIDTKKPTTLTDLQSEQVKDQSGYDRAEELMKGLNVQVNDMFNLQIGTYIAALISNGVFIASNYLQ